MVTIITDFNKPFWNLPLIMHYKSAICLKGTHSTTVVSIHVISKTLRF